jgi:thioredoxin-like negative regulator of GroEL
VAADDRLLAAVAASPDDLPLRMHVAELLTAAGRPAEALTHCTHALHADPADGACSMTAEADPRA